MAKWATAWDDRIITDPTHVISSSAWMLCHHRYLRRKKIQTHKLHDHITLLEPEQLWLGFIFWDAVEIPSQITDERTSSDTVMRCLKLWWGCKGTRWAWGISLGQWKCPKIGLLWWLHNSINLPKIIACLTRVDFPGFSGMEIILQWNPSK